MNHTERLKRAFYRRLYVAYRIDTHGNNVIALVAPNLVGVNQVTDTSWNRYSKSYHRQFGPTQIVNTTVRISRSWRTTVEHRGLAILDGLMTLAARRVATKSSCIIYRATWLEQGRGYTLRAVHGHIAVDDSSGDSYHSQRRASESERQAIERACKGLLRKLRAKQAAGKSTREQRADRLADMAKRQPGLTVTLDDAHSIGACNPGIRSWLNRAGFNPDTAAITIAELCDGFQVDPAPEAYRAALHAAKHSDYAD